MQLPALLRTVAVVAALLPAWCAAAPVGLFTILDGEAVLLRDTQRHTAAEGVRLRGDDIVRTGAATRLARIELADGTTLDLGADTELQLQPAAALGARAATLYLARGWLKIGAKPGAPEGVAGIASASFDLAKVRGSTVLHLTPQALLVFVESGSAELAERDEGRAGASRALRDGDAYVRLGNSGGSVQKRPPAELMVGLPRGFVDSLPRRSARFEALNVEPGPGEEIGYADVAGWINGEPALRQAALQRFAPRSRDRQFRAGLVAELRSHPEWDRLLFPEKYRPKPVLAAKRPAPVAAAAPAPAPGVVTVVNANSDDAALAVSLQGLMTWPSGSARNANPTTTLETR